MGYNRTRDGIAEEWGTIMAAQRENRRVQMTKRLLKDALLELLEQRELVNISVTAICEAADVHRSTFYKYYNDPAELLRDLEKDYLDRIPTPSPDMNQWDEEELLTETTAFFDFVKQNERAFRVFFGDKAPSSFPARLIDLLCREYVGDKADGDPTAYYTYLYIACGTAGMLREWVNAGFPVSSRAIAEMMYMLSLRVSQQQ